VEAHGINHITQQEGFKGIKKIAVGEHHTVMLIEGGDVYVWGRNQYGQCGLGKQELINEPQLLTDVKNVVDIACGANHTLFLTKDGAVYACGLSTERFPAKDHHVYKPIKLDGLDKEKVVGLSCGKRHNLLVTS